jgi:signal peptidase I
MGETKKKRRPAPAAIFNLVSSGLGFLYVGKIWWAVGTALSILGLLVLVSWTGWIFTPFGWYGVIIVVLAIAIGSIVLAAVFARRAGEMVLRRYQRRYVYIAYFVLVAAAHEAALGNRAEILGYETFRFPSMSMQNTLMHGDMFISDTRKFRRTSPERGELIVFRFPSDPSVKYVKRVLGVPGDVVAMKDGAVIVNDTTLGEPYVDPSNNVETRKWTATYRIPEDSYFVLGDNRDRSNDSRYWGFVPSANVHGSVEFIWFSYDPSEGIRIDRLGRYVN